MNGMYESAMAVLKGLGLLAGVGAIARGLVAFGRWRVAFRDRLLGLGAREQEAG